LATNLPANNALVRPAELQNPAPPSATERDRQVGFAANLAAGKPPSLAADAVMRGIRDGDFWLTTDNEWDPRWQAVFDSITQRSNPARPF
ncbi:MAG TPA: hypothetical protein VI759_09505, partial [Dehalococcoidia bacterium]|nr:hypothetical protein [Dehalococcoidia bacterium]